MHYTKFLLHRQKKYAVFIYASIIIYTLLEIMSFAKLFFGHHLNNMPVVGSLMSWSYTELLQFKNTRMGVVNSLCNYVTITG